MSEPQPNAAPDAAAIQSTIDAMTSAFARHDLAGILSTYEPVAVVVGQPGVPVTGRPALVGLFEQFIALDPKFTFAGHEIVQAGDTALHLSPWTMSGRAPDGSAVHLAGLSAAVLRRQPDGGWLMVIDHPFADHLLPLAGQSLAKVAASPA